MFAIVFFRNRKGRLDLLEEMQFRVSLERHIVVDRSILFRRRSHIKHFVNLTIQSESVYKLTWPNRYFRK